MDGDRPGAVRHDVQVRLLGPVEVRVGGEARDLAGPKLRTVLALLTLRAGALVTVADMASAVWGDAAPHGAAATLRTYLSRLRTAALGTRIVHESGGYRLVTVGLDCDVARFRDLVKRARAADDEGAAATALDLLADALGLWRGGRARGHGANGVDERRGRATRGAAARRGGAARHAAAARRRPRRRRPGAARRQPDSAVPRIARRPADGGALPARRPVRRTGGLLRSAPTDDRRARRRTGRAAPPRPRGDPRPRHQRARRQRRIRCGGRSRPQRGRAERRALGLERQPPRAAHVPGGPNQGDLPGARTAARVAPADPHGRRWLRQDPPGRRGCPPSAAARR